MWYCKELKQSLEQAASDRAPSQPGHQAGAEKAKAIETVALSFLVTFPYASRIAVRISYSYTV
jgi:hypothetical protein